MKSQQNFGDVAVEELEVSHLDLCKELFKLRNEKRLTGKVEAPHKIRETRKKIARLLTAIRAKRGPSEGSSPISK